MRRSVFALAAAAALALPLGATAEGDGCLGGRIVLGPHPAAVTACEYESRGGDKYAVQTANAWTITVKRGSIVVQKLTGGPTSPATAPAGALNTQAGDVVTLSLTPACLPTGDCLAYANFFLGAGPVTVA